MTATLSSSTGTESAERVADILLAILDADITIGVSAISRQLGLSKAVVHRVLQSLVSRGLVSYHADSRRYGLGPMALALGARAMRQFDLRAAAREHLVSLRNETEETTTLSILVVDKRAYIDQYESPQEIKMTVEPGRLYPLYAGASSRAILAFLPEADISRVINRGMGPLTKETIESPAELQRHLAETRSNMYATSRGERQSGAGSVAAPIFGADGQVLGSISVCGPIDRFDSETVARYVPLVISTAAEVSARLGAPALE